MPTLTTLADADQFWRDGFLFPIPVLAESEAAALASELLSVQATGVPDHPVPWNQKAHLLLPSLDRLLQERRLTDAVAEILGDDLLALSADVFIKLPRSNGRSRGTRT